VQDDKLRFNGQIRWAKGSNIIEWSERREDFMTKKAVTFTQQAVFKDSGRLA